MVRRVVRAMMRVGGTTEKRESWPTITTAITLDKQGPLVSGALDI